MDSVAVIVASYGEKEVWDKYAEKALASIYRQSRYPDEILRIHDSTLQIARNRGVAESTSNWCCFLDCDDEYGEFYLDMMLLAKGDVRIPRLQKVYPDGHLEWGQGICVGAMFRRDLFLQVGGFGNEPVLEDLALWQKMQKAGAVFGKSLAIYRAYPREGSRNSNAELKDLWASRILAS